MPRRLAVIVNRGAGGGRAGRLLPVVQRTLAAAGHDVLTTPTRSLAHADVLAAEALDDDRVAVAFGGDGLVGRVAGAVAAGGGLLGVLPGGRGNDFARSVGISRDPVRACAVLTGGQDRAVDLAVACGRPFLGIASVGFDSDVQERALVSRLPLGRLVYLWASLAAVASWQPAEFTGTVDGTAFRVDGWSVAVANSGVYGGGMRLAPAASVSDGRLDLVTISATSRVRFLRALPRLFRGTHVHDPAVRVQGAAVVEIACDRPFRVFADGDPVGELPCTVTVRPGALRVLLPTAGTALSPA